MTDDLQLLTRYTRGHADEAFAEIVKRHLPLVYSVALRKLAGDHALAKDVAQVVFIDLARKAASLTGQRSLAAWLHKSTCFAASKYVRTEQRRRTREEETIKMATHDTDANPEWNDLTPMLDDVLNELSDEDREAVVLRYFSGHKFAELGGRLGLTENTARMRVERAVEKLRGIFLRRGFTTTGATVLMALEQAPAAVVIPVGMTAPITTAALAAGSLSTHLIVAGATASTGSPAL